MKDSNQGSYQKALVQFIFQPETAIKLKDYFAKLSSGKQSQDSNESFEILLENLDGKHLDVILSATSIVWDQETRISVFMTDVSDRKQLEMQLQHAQKLEAVGQLAAGIAHEINTPIQFIGDSLSYIEESVEDLIEAIGSFAELITKIPDTKLLQKIQEKVDEIHENMDLDFHQEQLPKAFGRTTEGLSRVTRIVRAMKEFSRKDTTVKMGPGDINKAIESTVIVSANEFKYVADIELELDELPTIVCNLGDLNQVFLNLIVNASHAIAQKYAGKHKKGKIRIQTYQEDQKNIVVAISDDGPGIPQHVQPRIFEPFFTTKEVGKGTGQGFALAHTIIV